MLSFKVYDQRLASVAQSYAEQCIFAHNRHRTAMAGDPIRYPSVGENVYVSSQSRGQEDFERIVGSWFNEIRNYDYFTNQCNAQVCGHYLQV